MIRNPTNRHSNLITDKLTISRRTQSSSIWLLLAFPWLLTIVNRNWAFSNVWSLTDSWIYFGYFNNFPQLQYIYQDFDKVYFGDRLSWVLPGYILHHILPSIPANFVLHLGVYYVAILSLYYTLVHIVGQRSALLASLIMGGYSYFILANGTDYVEGAGIAYFLLAMFLLTQSHTKKRGWLWLTLTGAAIAGVIYTNLFWIVFTPYFALYYLFLNWQDWYKRIVRDTSFLIIGFTVITLLFCIISQIITGKFWFYAHSLSFANNLFNASKNIYFTYSPDWPLHSPHLVWPLVIFASCLFSLLVPKIRFALNKHYGVTFFIIAYVFTFLMMLFFQLRGSTPVLVVYYYAGYLQPAMFLAVGALLQVFFSKVEHKIFVFIVGFTALALLLSFGLRSCYGSSLQMQLTVAAVIVGLTLVAVAFLQRIRLWAYIALIGTFCFITPSAFAANYSSGMFCKLQPQPNLPGNYLAVSQGIQLIQRVAPSTRIYFWYDFNENPAYRSIAAAYLHSWNIVSEEFPSLKSMGAESESSPNSGITIALLSNDTNAIAKANESLGRYNRMAKIIAQEPIQQGEINATLTVLRIEPIPIIITVGDQIDFSINGNPESFLKKGWYTPEGFGSWTMGSQSTIELTLSDTPQADMTMTFDIAAAVGSFVQQRPVMVVDVIVNGTRLDQWNFNQDIRLGAYAVNVPKSLLQSSETIQIVLQIAQPHSLKELNYNDDQRQLGIAVRSLSLTPTLK